MLGGAIVAWEDHRTGTATTDIYAQRVNNQGVIQWQANGTPLCTIDGDRGLSPITDDGGGRTIVIWIDGRSGDHDIYMQHISALGLPLWDPNGIPMYTEPGVQRPENVIKSNGGYLIESFADYHTGNGDIYAQFFDLLTLTPVQEKSPRPAFALGQNYPNPFNPITTIKYAVNHVQHVFLSIYDMLGRKVTTLVDEERNPGQYSLEWKASQQSTGVYFYRLQTAEFVETKKLLLIR